MLHFRSDKFFYDNGWKQKETEIRIELIMTCVCFQVFGGHHDHESDGPFVAEHLVGPATDGAHALDGRYAVIGDQHLPREKRL